MLPATLRTSSLLSTCVIIFLVFHIHGDIPPNTPASQPLGLYSPRIMSMVPTGDRPLGLCSQWGMPLLTKRWAPPLDLGWPWGFEDQWEVGYFFSEPAFTLSHFCPSCLSVTESSLCAKPEPPNDTNPGAVRSWQRPQVRPQVKPPSQFHSAHRKVKANNKSCFKPLHFDMVDIQL